MEFKEFPKIPRFSREIVITEKIDGTNASIFIPEDDSPIRFGSRTRWITPEDDNFGFARWATENIEKLKNLGPGHHFGEWWGQGIQRKYGLSEKRFSLFNVHRWEQIPSEILLEKFGCRVVPTLYKGQFEQKNIDYILDQLKTQGSYAAPGFMNPEGIIIYHTAAKQMFKKTLDKDDEYKGKNR